MKGGPSVEVLLDLALGNDEAIAKDAAEVLKTQVFLYDADTDRLKEAYEAGNDIAKDILESYARADFFTKLPDLDEEIKVVTYIAAEGDISTDLLSPGNQAHSRADRELHGKCMISEKAQKEIEALKLQHPGKRVMLIAEKGTMGVGSSRMSGVNNVALWTGKQASPYVPFVNFAPIVAGTNGISPIFLTTVGVTGGIGVDLKNWVKKLGPDGNPILNNDGNPVLEQKYSVETGTVLTINTKKQKLFNEAGDEELVDMSSSFTPQKMEFMKAGGSYAIVFGKKLQTLAAQTLGIETPPVFAPSKEVSHEGQGLTAVEKIFNKNAVGSTPGKGSSCRLRRPRSGQHCRLAGHHGSDDFPGIGSHGRNGNFSARRRCVSVRLSHRICVGSEGSGQHTAPDVIHAQVWSDHRPRSEERLPPDDGRHSQGAERHHGRRLGHHHRR
jgi:aconitate hydratase 2/2-methylisocitrate dehydratase